MANLKRFPVSSFIFILIVLLFSPHSIQAADSASIQKADALMKDKKYSQALSIYESIVSEDPSIIEGYRNIIECYNALGDPQGAAVFMESLFFEHMDSGEVYYGMGYANYNMEKYKEAKNYFEKAIKMKPGLAEAWNNCAAVYHFIDKDYKKARQYYKKAIAISEKTGNKRVLEIARKNMNNLPQTAEIKLVKEKLTLEEFINRFISEVDKGDEKKVKGLVYGQKENSIKAMDWLLGEALRSFAEGRKDDESSAILLASLLEKEYSNGFKNTLLQKKFTAYSSLSDEKKIKIVQGDDLLQNGIIMENEGKYEKAQDLYSRAISCFETINDKSRAGTALEYSGDAFRSMKKYSDARKSYEKALTSFIQSGEEEKKASVLSSLGITCYMSGEYEDSLDYFERSLAIYGILQDNESEKKVRKNIEKIKSKTNKKVK